MRVWIESVKTKGKFYGYRVRYEDAGRKRHSEPGVFEKKGDAKLLKDAVELRLFSGRIGKVDPTLKTADLFEQWILACRAGTANKKGKVIKEPTIKTFRSSLAAVIKTCPNIKGLTPEWVTSYKEGLAAKKYTPWTAHRRLVDLKSFTSWLRRKGIINWDPFEQTAIAKPEPVARYFTVEQINALSAAGNAEPRLKLLMYLGYKCGLRQNEVIRGRREDVVRTKDSKGRPIGFLPIAADMAKNESARMVPIPPSVMALLGSDREGPLVPGIATEAAFLYHWARLKAMAGMLEPDSWYRRWRWGKNAPKPTGKNADDEQDFHKLRHTFCKNYLQSGGNIAGLRQITGHKDIQILVKTYSHFETEYLGDQVAAMDERQEFLGRIWDGPIEINETSSNESGQDDTLSTDDVKQAFGDK